MRVSENINNYTLQLLVINDIIYYIHWTDVISRNYAVYFIVIIIIVIIIIYYY